MAQTYFMETDSLFYPILQKQVLSACGIKHASEKNCREISVAIFKKDKNYLLGSTIKRFFDLVTGKDGLSPFVLESLAKFAGYQRWEDFKERNRTVTEFPGGYSYPKPVDPDITGESVLPL